MHFKFLRGFCTVEKLEAVCSSMTENGLDIYFLFTGDVLFIFFICRIERTSVLNI